MKETAIVIGASSGLGRALCKCLAERGYDIILSARNDRDLTATANDLEIRFGITAKVIPIDLAKVDAVNCNDYANQCFAPSIMIKQVYITAAVISSADAGDSSIQTIRQIYDINFFGVLFLFSALASRLRDIQSNITVISSIAAIRPRSQNISYSSSKIALEYFILGLKHHYKDNQINIQIYRTGYMDSAMSYGKKLLFPIAPTSKVASYLIKNRQEDFQIRYYPAFWKSISVLLLLLPWSLYKKLKF